MSPRVASAGWALALLMGCNPPAEVPSSAASSPAANQAAVDRPNPTPTAAPAPSPSADKPADEPAAKTTDFDPVMLGIRPTVGSTLVEHSSTVTADREVFKALYRTTASVQEIVTDFTAQAPKLVVAEGDGAILTGQGPTGSRLTITVSDSGPARNYLIQSIRSRG